MTEYILAFDRYVLAVVQGIGPIGYEPAWILSALIGSAVVLVPTVVIALFFIGKGRVALETLLVSTVSFGIVVLLKDWIGAPRPYWEDASVVAYIVDKGFGMPSGHALMSMVVFGWLWWRHPKSLVLSVAAPFFIFMVGLARVFLGVHYPSQVIAGWILGGLLLWLFLWIDRWYFRPRSNHVERGSLR